jgi:hypothetical protein
MANLSEIKRFFGYDNSKKFAEDWRTLSDAEKEFFKKGVGQALGKEE